MPDQTPAQTLRAAAEKLRAAATAAEKASPSPWRLDYDSHGAGIIYAADDATIVVDRSLDDPDDDHGDLPYIALMHPGVGRALADWLELTADVLNSRTIAAPSDEYTVDISDEHALLVARAILGGAS